MLQLGYSGTTVRTAGTPVWAATSMYSEDHRYHSQDTAKQYTAVRTAGTTVWKAGLLSQDTVLQVGKLVLQTGQLVLQVGQ